MCWWLVVFFAIFLIGVTKSGFGSGVGLIVVPIAAIAMGHIPGRREDEALGLLLPLLIIGDLIALYQYRKLLLPARSKAPALVAAGIPDEAGAAKTDFSQSKIENQKSKTENPHPVRHLLPGTAAGIILGGALLWYFHRQPPAILIALIRIEIGFESILLVAIHWWRQYRGEQQRLIPEPFRSHLTGAFAGASSTLAHAAGPIIVMYLLPLHLSRQMFVGVCAVYFFLLNTAKLPAYWLSGQFSSDLPPLVRAAPAVLVLAGAMFGYWLNRRMSDSLFTAIIYAATFLLGWYMLIDGALRLL